MRSTYPVFMALNMIDFGKNLAALRKSRQLTQAQLATLLAIQPRLIGRWEQGQGKPQFDYLLKLADVLEVSFDQLLLGNAAARTIEFEIRNKQLKELCRKVDALPPSDQEVICHFLDMAVRNDQLKRLTQRSA